jgi:hypothetical protein
VQAPTAQPGGGVGHHARRAAAAVQRIVLLVVAVVDRAVAVVVEVVAGLGAAAGGADAEQHAVLSRWSCRRCTRRRRCRTLAPPPGLPSSTAPSQSLSTPSHDSTPPPLGVHWYSQPGTAGSTSTKPAIAGIATSQTPDRALGAGVQQVAHVAAATAVVLVGRRGRSPRRADGIAVVVATIADLHPTVGRDAEVLAARRARLGVVPPPAGTRRARTPRRCRCRRPAGRCRRDRTCRSCWDRPGG